MTGNATERSGDQPMRLPVQSLAPRLLDERDPLLMRIVPVRRGGVVVGVGDVGQTLPVDIDLEEVEQVTRARGAIGPRSADRTPVDEARGRVLLERGRRVGGV